MSNPKQTEDLGMVIADIRRRLGRLESPPAQQGALKFNDGSNDVIIIGQQADGSYGIWIGSGANIIKLTGNGANVGKASIPQTLAVTGLLTALGGIATGQNTVHIFTGTSDPAASAVEGDVWLNG